MQTIHFLHAVMASGGKTYQAGFAIFSSKLVKLRDLEVSSERQNYDWDWIQIDMFVDI